MKAFFFLVYLIVISQLYGCVKYEKKELIPREVFKEIELLRNSPSDQAKGNLTFSQSAAIMSNQNLQLKTVLAEYEVYRNIADISTPLPNPSIEVGANFASPFSSISKSVVPFAAIGFTIPLGGKLKKNDALNKAKALRALVETQILHRKLYLQLRESFISLITLKQKKLLQEKINTSTNLLEKTLNLQREAGGFDLLDIGIVELNNLQIKTNQFEWELEFKEELAQFSILLGVDNSMAEMVDINELPARKNTLPDFEKLKETMIDNHFSLATLRYDYEIAEKSLCLEISKQYPDISFGAEHEQEISDKSNLIGLRLGINIPLFDRNQQGISQALKERELVKKSYEQTVNEALATLKKEFDQLTVQMEKNKFIQEVILKKAELNLNLVEKNLKIGAVDILKYLEVLRTYHEVSISALNSERDLLMAWVNIEKTIGFPILVFPNEGTFQLPLQEVESDKKNEKINGKEEK